MGYGLSGCHFALIRHTERPALPKPRENGSLDFVSARGGGGRLSRRCVGTGSDRSRDYLIGADLT